MLSCIIAKRASFEVLTRFKCHQHALFTIFKYLQAKLKKEDEILYYIHTMMESNLAINYNENK